MFKIFSRTRAGSAPSSNVENGVTIDSRKRTHQNLQNRIIICEEDASAQQEALPCSLSLSTSARQSALTKNDEMDEDEESDLNDETQDPVEEIDEGYSESSSEGSKAVAGIWLSRSFLDEQDMVRRRKEHRCSASTGSLSTSAPSAHRSALYMRFGETDESFGRKVPKHVANQERMFSFAANSLQPKKDSYHHVRSASASTVTSSPSTSTPTTHRQSAPITHQVHPKEVSFKLLPSKPVRPELKGLVDAARELKAKHPNVYQQLVEISSKNAIDQEHAASNAMRGQKNGNQILHAIANDVTRTFRDTDMFAKTGSEGHRQLFRILSAYALYAPQVGYCQGLNLVVGEMLSANFGEEDAFWALHHLMKKHYLEGMFLPGLPGVKKALKRFEVWFSTLMPSLYVHFEHEGIKTEMFTSKWFMSLYAAVLPLDMVVKIWQAFIQHGWIVIWSVGLALLYFAQDILLKSNFEDILVYIQSVGKHISTAQQDSVLKQMNIFMHTIKNQKEQLRLLQSF